MALYNVRNFSIRTQQQILQQTANSVNGNLKDFFQGMQSLILTVAENRAVQEGLPNLKEGFNRLSQDLSLDPKDLEAQLRDHYLKEYLPRINEQIPGAEPKKIVDNYLPLEIEGRLAQYLFILENPNPVGAKEQLITNEKYKDSPYVRTHTLVHPSLAAVLKNFELYDIFLVDLEGNVIYTAYKEKDYATNLKTGIYRNTGLGKAYADTLRLAKGQVAFQDLMPYEPSYNAPAAFIGTPLFIQEERAGSLIFQIPVDKQIQDIISFDNQYEKVGLGLTGEAFLIGTDLKMRSNSRFLESINDPVIKSYKSTVGVMSAATPALKTAIQGTSSALVTQNYLGKLVLGSYMPIDVLGVKWALGVEIEEDEALKDLYKLQFSIIIISLLLTTLCVLFSLLAVNRLVNRPLSSFAKYLKEKAVVIQDGGDVASGKIAVEQKDEFEDLATCLNTFIAKVAEMIHTTKEVVQKVSESTKDLLNIAHTGNQTSAEQTMAVKEVTGTMEDSEKLARQIASKIESIALQANDTTKQVEQGFKYLEENLTNINNIQATSLESIDSIKKLGEQIASIWDIVNIINSIADQTKIIAFNAELEASSAGDAGKNFQIVATEIRRLADHTVSSTGAIKKKITEIQASSDVLVISAEKAMKQVEAGCESSQALKKVFGMIRSSADDNSTASQSITISIQQQAQASEQVLITLKLLADGIEHLSRLTQSTTTTSESVNTIIGQLSELVDKYKILDRR
jgi:methyl-accepting chemotaxis protein